MQTIARVNSRDSSRLAAAGVLLAAACSGAALAGVIPCGCVGDVNVDGWVDGADITALLGNWGTANAAADLDDNGIVDGGDITVLLGNWGPCGSPANDSCGNAQLIGPGSYQLCNYWASTDGPALPADSCGESAINIFDDLWFRFAPLSDGVLEIDTCGSDIDTVMALYGSVIQGLSPCPSEGFSLATYLECNDDVGSGGGPGCDGLSSRIIYEATAGNVYKIRVGSWSSNVSGAITLNVKFTSEGSECANPITTSFSNHQVIVGNTSDNPVDAAVPGDCFAGFAKGPMEWITYTNTCTGILTLSTCNPGTDYDTVLTVLRYEFDGNCWSTFIECNDDFAGDPDCALPSGQFRRSFLQVSTSPGEVFRIVVSGFNGQSGNYELTIDRDCN